MYSLRALLRWQLAQQQETAAQAVFGQVVELFEGLDMPQEIDRTRALWQKVHLALLS